MNHGVCLTAVHWSGDAGIWIPMGATSSTNTNPTVLRSKNNSHLLVSCYFNVVEHAPFNFGNLYALEREQNR